MSTESRVNRGLNSLKKILDLLNIYVHGDSLALPDLVQYLLLSKKWSTTFRLTNSKDDSSVQDKVLHSIVKEYQECKKLKLISWQISS